MRLFNEIAKRGVAFLLLAATAFATITYSLGYYELSFIKRGEEEYDDETLQDILGSLGTGTNISDFTGDINDITQPPSTSSPSSSLIEANLISALLSIVKISLVAFVTSLICANKFSSASVSICSF